MTTPRATRLLTNGIRLNVVQDGPDDGPLVILLHGFPETARSWRRQQTTLAAAGFRVWAPDQRGYGLSDKPPRVRDYRLATLAADIVGLIDAAGAERACIAGHDWGAMVAWWLGIAHPDRVARLAVLNVPHPAVLVHAIRRDPDQLRRSWYTFFFQLPWLPEALYRRDDWALGVRSLLGSSRRGTFTADDLAAYRAAWAQPGAIRSMIHWYRAFGRFPLRYPAGPRVTVPTMILWGAHDRFLKATMARDSLGYCDVGRLEYFAQATHWLHHEEPERVGDRLRDFFRGA